MNLKFNILIVAAALSAICGCEKRHHSHAQEEGHEHATSCSHGHKHEQKHKESSSCTGKHNHEDSPNDAKAKSLYSVSVPQRVQRAMGLKTVHAEMRRITSTVSFPGRYELNPDAHKVVSSPVSGRINMRVRALSNVKKGQILFTVASPDVVSRSKEIEVLEKRLSVYKEIETANAVLENELAVKRAERESLLAGAEEKDGVVVIRATEDTMVNSIIVKDGAWMEIGSAALETVRMRDLRFKALVTSSDALRLRDGMSAEVGANQGVVKIGIGDDSGLVPIYILFDAEINAIAGERAQAECVTDETEESQLAVPSKCIVKAGVQPVIFARDEKDKDKFVALGVTPGVSGGGWTVIDDISAHGNVYSIEIVSDGAYELKLAQPSNDESRQSGHFHADGSFHAGEH